MASNIEINNESTSKMWELENENKILKEHLTALYLNISYLLTAHTPEPDVDPDGLQENGKMQYGKYDLVDYLGRNGRYNTKGLEYCYNKYIKPEINK